MTRYVFRFGHENGLTDKPVEFGDYFKPPKKVKFTQHRHDAGEKRFGAKRFTASWTLPTFSFAMTLLALNAGFGNSDVAAVPQSAFDIEPGWVIFPRVKTAVHRRIPLWPETIEAVQEAIASRPDADDPAHADLVFVTRCGMPWVRTQERKRREADTDDGKPRPRVIVDSVSCEFAKLLRTLGINGHRNFYTLRHTFQTQADECRDFIAVRRIMGHSGGGDIADAYRERVSDERLKSVTDAVRAWLYGKEGGAI